MFRALADPTRRSLLDELFREDGQTLHRLEAGRDMTRFGVMKHLRVLEDAGLVVTRRRGREKLHYLNAVPIRLVHDRWVSKYAEPWTAALADLKHGVEATAEERTMEKVFEIYIRATPEQLWDAITDPAQRPKYNFGVAVRGSWVPGGHVELYSAKHDVVIGEGDVLEVDPPRRLVHTQVALWSDEAREQGATRVTWEIQPIEDTCRLTVVHELHADATEDLYGGWPMILSGLKTWVETGEVLTTPGSLRYA